MDDLQLVEIARSMIVNAYAPYSGFSVGSALLTDSGKVYTGANIENVAYGATVCGERVAALKAAVEGERNFKVIVIASSGDDLVLPCGICRQFLAEFADEDMRIICTNKKGDITEFHMGELLPNAFCKF